MCASNSWSATCPGIWTLRPTRTFHSSPPLSLFLIPPPTPCLAVASVFLLFWCCLVIRFFMTHACAFQTPSSNQRTNTVDLVCLLTCGCHASVMRLSCGCALPQPLSRCDTPPALLPEDAARTAGIRLDKALVGALGPVQVCRPGESCAHAGCVCFSHSLLLSLTPSLTHSHSMQHEADFIEKVDIFAFLNRVSCLCSNPLTYLWLSSSGGPHVHCEVDAS